MMASTKEDEDGFRIVKKKGRKNISLNPCTLKNNIDDEQIDFEALKVKVWQTRQELKPSCFIRELKETWKVVQEKLESDPTIFTKFAETVECTEPEDDEECTTDSSLPPELLERLGQLPKSSPKKNEVISSIVCYGLGNFSTCPIARYQLGLLLLLSNMIQVSHARCFCFDPRFTRCEVSFLEDLGLSVIKTNEEGKRVCKEPTLFFMPHCGKPLYNNLLWANWGPDLHKLIILGNSFSSFHDRIPEAQLLSEALYVAKILPFTYEERVKNNFVHKDIFNDLAFHIFNSERINSAPDGTWTEHPMPSYDHIEDLEIILNSPKS